MNSPAEIWSVIHAEREAMAADLDQLEPSLWQTPSLCLGWDVHDVLAHLVDTAKTTRLGFAWRLITAGFDFDKDNQRGVVRERAADPVETVARLRAVTSRTTGPPAAIATRLVEAFVHGEDIRQPLGIHRSYPALYVSAALTYQVNTTVKMGGGRERAASYRLIATDVDFDHGTGSGSEVRGKAIDLLLAVSGRPVPAGALSGSGAEAFAQQGQDR